MILAMAIEWHYLELLIWFLLTVTGAFGLLAVVSPRLFDSIAARGGTWIDSAKFLAVFDKRIDIDGPLLQHSRVFGVAVVTAVLFLGYSLWTR